MPPRPAPIRIAIVGLGKIARDQHLPAIAKTPGIELAAIVSRNAALPGTPSFPHLQDLLASDTPFDAVALCAPPQVRHAQAALALAAGKHVLLEKPPGATTSELEPLRAAAAHARLTLFASWHSRFAAAVEPARARLAGRLIHAVRIDWKEDVRVWHPGQAWIFEPGGLGVFDPGINALSILTRILPHPPFVTAATLQTPENKQAPSAATIDLTDANGLPIRAEFDFLQTGPQTWDIELDTDQGPLRLSHGASRLTDNGQPIPMPESAEYPGLYRHFRDLVAQRRSDLDLAPLALVADAFLLARRSSAPPFHE